MLGAAEDSALEIRLVGPVTIEPHVGFRSVDLFSIGIQLGTLLVAAVGVTLGVPQLRQGNRQQLLELGSLYIQRYWQIDDDLLRLPKGSPEHTHARHRYLRLCEDEIEAARNGWLDQKQWRVWHSWLARKGAQDQLRLDLEACDRDSSGFEHVRRCLASGPDHEWTHCSAHLGVVTNGPAGEV